MSDSSSSTPPPWVQSSPPAPPAAPPPPPAPTPTPAPATTTRPPAGFWVALAGAVLGLIGAFLPWATATTAFGQFEQSGTDGDGKLTALGSVAVGVLAASFLRRRASYTTPVAVIVGILGLGVFAVGVYDAQDIQRKINELPSDEFSVAASVGSGVWLTIFAGIVVVTGAALVCVLRARPRRAARA